MGRKRVQFKNKFDIELEFVKHTLLLNSPAYIFSIDAHMQSMIDIVNRNYIPHMHKIANATSVDQATSYFVNAERDISKEISAFIEIKDKSGKAMFYNKRGFINFIKPSGFSSLRSSTASELKKSILKQISTRKKIDNLFFKEHTLEDNFNYHDYTPFLLTDRATPVNELLSLYPNWYESDEVEDLKASVIAFCHKFGFFSFKFSEHTSLIDAFRQLKYLDECFSELAHDCGIKYAAIGLNYLCNFAINCKENFSGQFDSDYNVLTLSRDAIEWGHNDDIKSTILHETIHAHDYSCHNIQEGFPCGLVRDYISANKSFALYQSNVKEGRNPRIGSYIMNDIISTIVTGDYSKVRKLKMDSIPKIFDNFCEFWFSVADSTDGMEVPTFDALSLEQKTLVLSEIFIARVCDLLFPYSHEDYKMLEEFNVFLPHISDDIKDILILNTLRNFEKTRVRKYNIVEENVFKFDVSDMCEIIDDKNIVAVYQSLVEMLKKIFAFEDKSGGTALSFAKITDKIAYSKALEVYDGLKKFDYKEFSGIAPILDLHLKNNRSLEVDSIRLYYYQDPGELLARYFETNIYFWESQKYNYRRKVLAYSWKKCPEFEHFKDEFFVSMFGFDVLAPVSQPNHPIYHQPIKGGFVELETTVAAFSSKVSEIRNSLESQVKNEGSIFAKITEVLKNIKVFGKESIKESISMLAPQNVEDVLSLPYSEKQLVAHIKTKNNRSYL